MKLTENFNTELKKILTSELKKEVVAFANTCDGTIYIGIDDDGEVVGLENSDDVIERASGAIRNAIKPDLTMYVKLNIEKINDKEVVVIRVQRGASRPYYIAEKGLKPSGVYVRQGNSSIPASEDRIREMIKETDGHSFERLRSIEQNLTFDYADREFRKKGIEFGEVQKKTLGLIDEDNLYTNLGLLFSDQCKHTIKIAVFQGKNKSIFKSRKEFTGSILQQLNDAFEYIDVFNLTRATFEGLTRKDERDYPVEAIREALLNTVVHREYSFSGSILINIYEDRIEFISLGGIISGLSLEAVLLGVSQSRNERLSNVFYRLRLIEAYGTGIPKIMRNYEEYPYQPIFKAETGVFLVILPNVHNEVIKEKENINLTDGQEKIIQFLKEGEKTRKDIEKLMNLKQTRVLKLLKELQELKLIEKKKRGREISYKNYSNF